MYIPQLVPVMNSVTPNARNIATGKIAGFTCADTDSITKLVNPISSFTAANSHARTISIRGMIIFCRPFTQ